MRSGLIVNPIKPTRDEIERVADICESLFLYCLGENSRFPFLSAEELAEAAAKARAYNEQRAFGGSCMLWPSVECIQFALGFFAAGDHASSLPPLKIGKTDKGELYFYF